MKTLAIKSNHGNHQGFNRTWKVLESFTNEESAQEFLANLHNEVKEINEEHEDFETSTSGFEDDLYYYTTITQDDYDKGVFNGGHYGHASDEIISFFEEE